MCKPPSCVLSCPISADMHGATSSQRAAYQLKVAYAFRCSLILAPHFSPSDFRVSHVSANTETGAVCCWVCSGMAKYVAEWCLWMEKFRH